MKIASIIGMLMAGFPRRLRVLMGGLCFLIALPVVFMVGVAEAIGVPGGPAVGAARMFGIDVALIWALYAYGSRNLMIDARALQLPGVAHAWCRTTALFLTVSVLLPAAALGLRWKGFAEIVPEYLCAAAAGMLLSVIPTRPMSFGWTAWWFVFMLLKGDLPNFPMDRVMQGHLPLSGLVALWSLSAVLCALAVWRWRALILRSDGTRTAWQPASAADAGNKASAANAFDREKRLARAGAQWPKVAMRYWLGGPFVPQPFATNWLTWLLLIALFAVLAHKIGAVASIALAVPILPLSLYWTQLRRLFAKQGGEMVELALLPGWGDAAAAQRTLLAAVFQPTAKKLVVLLVAIEILALLVHADAATHWSLACVLVVGASTAATYCLYALAHRRTPVLLDAYLLCFGIYLAVVFVAGCFGMHWIGLPAWCALTAIHCGAMAVFASSAYADFRRQAHPFLMS